MQEILNFESVGKDEETVWRLSLISKTDLGAIISIMKGKTQQLAYSMDREETIKLFLTLEKYLGFGRQYSPLSELDEA